MRASFALICGSIRNLSEFLYVIDVALRLRDAGAVRGVVFSTWRESLAGYDGLEAWLTTRGVACVASPFAAWRETLADDTVNSPLFTVLIQATQLHAGLDLIRQQTWGMPSEDVFVLKLRSDITALGHRQFTADLLSGRAAEEAEKGRLLVAKFSTLYFFDIPELVFFGRLSEVQTLAVLSHADQLHYTRLHNMPETIYFGTRHARVDPLFGLLSHVNTVERGRLRARCMAGLAAGHLEQPLAVLMGRYLQLIAANYSLTRTDATGVLPPIEALFRPDGAHGIELYRDHNTSVWQHNIVQGLREGRMTATSAAGRAVLAALAAAERRTADETRQTAIEVGVFLQMEIIDNPEQRLVVAAKMEALQALNRTVVLQDAVHWLEHLVVPPEAALTMVEIGSLSDVDMMDICAVADRLIGAMSSRLDIVTEEKLAFWTNIFISFGIGAVVLPLAQRAIPAIGLLDGADRRAHSAWLESVGLRFVA